MSEERIGNLLAIQCGKPCLVNNTILSGVVSEALNHSVIEEIYGCRSGLQGLLEERLVDLAEESQQTIRGLRHTPAAALETSDKALAGEADLTRAVEVLKAHEIRFLVLIGDASTTASAHLLSQKANEAGADVSVLVIPTAADNSLAVTDHALGYGSAAKAITTRFLEFKTSVLAGEEAAPIGIFEIAGQESWYAGAATLAKHRNHPDEAPHIACVPQGGFDASMFLEAVQGSLKKSGPCFIVTTQRLMDTSGNFIALPDGSPADAGNYMATLIQESLGLSAEVATYSHSACTGAQSASGADNDESFAAGQAAVRFACENRPGVVTTMRAESEGAYTSEPSLAAFESVLAAAPKAFPAEWVAENGLGLRQAFYKYAFPLIQGEVNVPFESGIAQFAKLSNHRVSKKLERIG